MGESYHLEGMFISVLREVLSLFNDACVFILDGKSFFINIKKYIFYTLHDFITRLLLDSSLRFLRLLRVNSESAHLLHKSFLLQILGNNSIRSAFM